MIAIHQNKTCGCFSLVFIISILSACVPISGFPFDGITRQKALDIALASASTSRPEISAPQVQPFNVQAEKLPLTEALKRLSAGNTPAAGFDPQLPVWLVSMDGLWLDEFPRPDGFPTPQPYRHFFVILDAKTGMEIESAAKP
ncbi:MAG TPA: hypothetical protein VGK00_09605 [Anaerolineales bacterium]